MKNVLSLLFGLGVTLFSSTVFGKDLKVGDPAPSFTAKTFEGKGFDLQSRKDQWT